MKPSRFFQNLFAASEGLARDERGTTMTEFLITLPIFITIFVGIVQIGAATAKSVAVDANAYVATWNKAIPVQKQPFHVIHALPAAAGAVSLTQLTYQHASTPAQAAVIAIEEAATYGLGLTPHGTMGESYYRVKPIDPMFDLFDLEGQVVKKADTAVIGNSVYVKDLMDESVNFSASGSGALAVLNSLLSSAGVRPAIAAGMRYGTVVGTANDSSNYFKFNVNYSAHFTTLVAPYPMGTGVHEAITTAVTRLTMESYDPYKEVLGIKFSQPLSGESLNVPDLKPVLWAPCGVSGCDSGGP